MMDGCNSQFMSSPEVFIQANVINNINWFQNVGRPTASIGRSLIDMADALKEANFDLTRIEVNEGRNVYELRLCNQVLQRDRPIDAYWCPFVQGNLLPGYVDVPRNKPNHRFVFTPAMNGCAFVVTNSPKGPGWFRVYHNQHPERRFITQHIINESGDNILSYFSFDDYGTRNDPNAFNFLYCRNSTWMYVSQPQRFTPNAQGFGVGYRPGAKVVIRSVF